MHISLISCAYSNSFSNLCGFHQISRAQHQSNSFSSHTGMDQSAWLIHWYAILTAYSILRWLFVNWPTSLPIAILMQEFYRKVPKAHSSTFFHPFLSAASSRLAFIKINVGHQSNEYWNNPPELDTWTPAWNNTNGHQYWLLGEFSTNDRIKKQIFDCFPKDKISNASVW